MKGFSITRGSNIFSIRSDIFWPKDLVNCYLFTYLFSLYLKLTFPSLELKPINVN